MYVPKLNIKNRPIIKHGKTSKIWVKLTKQNVRNNQRTVPNRNSLIRQIRLPYYVLTYIHTIYYIVYLPIEQAPDCES